MKKNKVKSVKKVIKNLKKASNTHAKLFFYLTQTTNKI
jgi:hypothetical protein